MRSPRLPRLVGVFLTFALVACGDPTKPKATGPNFQLDYSVYALTGGPGGAPNAIGLFSGPAKADANFAFDVALDIDPAGKLLMYPVRAVAGTLAGGLGVRVGLQTVPGAFEAVREAPATGYDTLSVRTITPGTTVVAEVLDQLTAQCAFSLGGQNQYAKFVVDSVNPTTRRFYLRSVVDGSCGYHSLVPDSIPTF